MLDAIADRADIIIAAVQTALTLDMLPTIWTQFRAKASTVPLTSSVPTAIGLSVLGLVFFSTGLYIATGTVLVGSVMWALVAAQRIAYSPQTSYNKEHGVHKNTRVSRCEVEADEGSTSWSVIDRSGSKSTIEPHERTMERPAIPGSHERDSQGEAQP